MKVRRATPDDAAAIARVHAEAWRVGYQGLVRAPVPTSEAIWRERLAQAQPVTFVTDPVTGFVTVGPAREDPALGELWALYVDPPAWGQGTATALHDRAMAELRRSGHHRVILWVLAGNARAAAFYERRGLAPDGAVRQDVLAGETLPHERWSATL